MTVSVCACLCEHISGNTRPIFTSLCACFYERRHTCAEAKAAQRGRPANGNTALGLDYKWRVGIPVAGQCTHTHGAVWAY